MPGGCKRRFDVYTDAGPAQRDFYRIAHAISPTNAFALQRILRRAGWRVRIEEIAEDPTPRGES